MLLIRLRSNRTMIPPRCKSDDVYEHIRCATAQNANICSRMSFYRMNFVAMTEDGLLQ